SWPPRSPDLSPLDHFLWGTLKKVYREPPTTVEDMQEQIRAACATLASGTIHGDICSAYGYSIHISLLDIDSDITQKM
ncbi:hypothetical protein WH47_02352, partial [Habropoda laboriosa]